MAPKPSPTRSTASWRRRVRTSSPDDEAGREVRAGDEGEAAEGGHGGDCGAHAAVEGAATTWAWTWVRVVGVAERVSVTVMRAVLINHMAQGGGSP